MILSDFLYSPQRHDHRGSPDGDALREQDALVDAALLEVKFDATLMSLWLLFDCRGTLHMDDGNTAVVMVHQVTDFRWSGTPFGQRRWRSVASWSPVLNDTTFSATLKVLNVGATAPDTLYLTGTCGEFHVGDIPGGDDAPPDFTSAADEEIRAGLASWNSPFTPIHSSHHCV